MLCEFIVDFKRFLNFGIFWPFLLFNYINEVSFISEQTELNEVIEQIV